MTLKELLTKNLRYISTVCAVALKKLEKWRIKESVKPKKLSAGSYILTKYVSPTISDTGPQRCI